MNLKTRNQGLYSKQTRYQNYIFLEFLISLLYNNDNLFFLKFKIPTIEDIIKKYNLKLMRNTESEEFSFWYKNRILICTDYGKIYCNIEYNDIDTKFYIPDYNYRFYIRE